MVVFSILLGCNKPDPLVPIATPTGPEFFVKGMKNGTDTVAITAGKNGMYMFAVWEQSKYNAVDSVYQFQGIIAPVGCISCSPRFGIVFIDSVKSSKGQSSSIQNFLVPRNFNFISNSLLKGGVYVSWVGTTGINYVSRKSNIQPAFANFQVLKVEDYKENNGVKTKKIKVKFSCRCFNTLTDFVDLKDMEGTIVVGYNF